MANYIINKTDNTPVLIGGLSPTIIDTTATSLQLIGQNTPNYGTALNQNFVRLLENFAFTASPPNPLRGQLWWDTGNNILRVYSGQSWKISTGATSKPTNSPPTDLSSLGGDLWFDTTTSQLKVWTGVPGGGPQGDGWIRVGPAAPTGLQQTIIESAFLLDDSGHSHQVLEVNIANKTYAIIAAEIFTVAPGALAGFSSIIPGINFSSDSNWKLNNQSIYATAGTIVERDSSAGITGAAINGTIITASASMSAPSVTASFFGNLTGNVTTTTVTTNNLNASGTITTGNLAASSGIYGTLTLANQPNITGLGNVVNLSTNGTTTLTGYATYNGQQIATIGGNETFASINNTPIGNAIPSTGAFTTITGTFQGAVISPTYGGTGVNNGTNTLTVTANLKLNQNVEVNSSPTLRGTNFNSIPNGALVNSGITIGNTFVALGGTYSSAATVSSIAGTSNQINASASTGAVTLSLPQSIATSSGVTFGSLNVGAATGATTGQIRASDNITAYASSDAKFKENIRPIPNALATVLAIGGDLFDWTDEYIAAHGGEDGYFVRKADFGVIAQKVQAVFPQGVRTREDGSLAVDYEKLSALAFAAIGDLSARLAEIEQKIK